MALIKVRNINDFLYWGPFFQWDISTDTPLNSPNKSWQENYYFNVQPLNAYWLRVVFMAKDASNINNPDNPSLDFEIRKNM
ncbi:MAG: hypothetical protein ACK5QC_02915 [Bacteroidota bacterium]|jgi:hypothetical protein